MAGSQKQSASNQVINSHSQARKILPHSATTFNGVVPATLSSALPGLSIRLADPVLEKDRQRYVRAKELSQEGLQQIMHKKTRQPERDSSRDYRGK
jgi:hypothetical protein